ncbi:MAG TPA: nucleotidyltransferase domain-containing protein [Steroidobacteraceae bacterium]|nr:nucleotidyltransferase domain-containing protein [Steroidobacteraceae bacterium]
MSKPRIVMPKLGIVVPIMGIRKKPAGKPQPLTMADALFSGTQQRVLGLLFGQPSRSYYANELIALAGIGSGAVQRELTRLEQSGLVTVRAVGNQRHYQANSTAPLFAELCGIVQKTMGLADPLREALKPFESQIEAAFVYGSVAKGRDTASSDVDVMLISDDLSYADVYPALEDVGVRLGRPVNPTILSRKELSKRVKADSAFVTRTLSQAKVWLIGGKDALGAGESVRAE